MDETLGRSTRCSLHQVSFCEVMVSVAVFLPFRFPVTLTTVGLVLLAFCKVGIFTFALFWPAAMFTEAGIVAGAGPGGISLESGTVTPPAGAGTFNVTVRVDGLPPSTEVGSKVRLAMLIGVLMVKPPASLLPW